MTDNEQRRPKVDGHGQTVIDGYGQPKYRLTHEQKVIRLLAWMLVLVVVVAIAAVFTAIGSMQAGHNSNRVCVVTTTDCR